MRCCMCGLSSAWPRVMLHVVSQCGCGSGQSLSPGLLVGMTGVTLAMGLHPRFQNMAVGLCPMALLPDLLGSLLHLLSSCLLVCSVSQCLSFSFNFSYVLGLFMVLYLYFILGNSVLGYEVCACSWWVGSYWGFLGDSRRRLPKVEKGLEYGEGFGIEVGNL